MEIVIPKNVHDKVMHWVRKTDQEVSGFGKVLRNKETGEFTVVDAWLLDQEVGSSHTDIDEKALGKLMFETKDMEGDLRWWWHSHVNMAVFWSSTDKETINDLGKNGWIVASVFNKSEEVRSALCYKYSYESEFGKGEQVSFHDEIETTILTEIDDVEVAKWDKEFDTKVKKKSDTLGKQWEYNPLEGVGRYTGEGRAASVIGTVSEMDRDPGLLGYGIKAEAMALNMTVPAYWAVMESGDIARIKKLELALEKLEAQDKIMGAPYAYY